MRGTYFPLLMIPFHFSIQFIPFILPPIKGTLNSFTATPMRGKRDMLMKSFNLREHIGTFLGQYNFFIFFLKTAAQRKTIKWSERIVLIKIILHLPIIYTKCIK